MSLGYRMLRATGVNQARHISSIVRTPASANTFRITKRAFSLDFKPEEMQEYTVDPLDETARSALSKSCYLHIAWKVSENASVYDAVKMMSANNIGALAVVDDKSDVVGIISERDYLNKVGVLNRTSKETLVKEIATMGRANLVSVTLDNPIDRCMEKMINSNVRHLFVRKKDTNKIVGLISVKDIVKCSIAKHKAVVGRLTGFLANKEGMEKDY